MSKLKPVSKRRDLRHLRSLIRHSNPKKLMNLLTTELEYKRSKIKLKGRPYIFFIDACNRCNLSCALCPTVFESFNQPRKMLTFSEYKQIFSQVSDYAIEINLYNWGEPFLNPDIFDIIRYTRDRNVGTNCSTNLKAIKPKQVEAIIESGLEYLVVSLDGTDQEVYSKYRIGGNYDKVIENLRLLIETKRRLGSKTPVIEWQFLVMKHNEHQMDQARELAAEIGVDLIRFASAGLPFEEFNNLELAEEWMPHDPEYWNLNPTVLKGDRQWFVDSKCYYLYRSMTINPTGGVSPCCVVYDKKYDFGNMLNDDLENIWNNEKYMSARSIFIKSAQPNNAMPCSKCAMFKKGTFE